MFSVVAIALALAPTFPSALSPSTLPRAALSMALLSDTELQTQEELEPKAARFKPFGIVRSALSRVNRLVNRRWRSKAAITDALLTARLRNKDAEQAVIKRDLAELGWEEHLLPSRRTSDRVAPTDLMSWEDRLTPDLTTAQARLCNLGQFERLLPDVVSADEQPITPPTCEARYPRRSLTSIDAWEERLFAQPPVPRCRTLADLTWEDRLLPDVPAAPSPRCLSEGGWEDRLLP